MSNITAADGRVVARDILLRPEAGAGGVTQITNPSMGWKIAGWCGLLLSLVAFTDLALHWYPAAFHSPEWEFGTVAISFGSLPLMTVGLAMLAASFVARGVRWGMITTAVALIVLVVLIAAAYGLFLLNVPLALKAAVGPAGLTLKKAIVRTSVMGVGFGACYLFTAVVLLRNLSRKGNT